MLKTASAAIALSALANPALAGGCATQSEAAALRTAVIQQELMVAAFQCRETKAYNRFVTTYRKELQSSDAALKSFFVRRGGEAGYDSFKTKAANLSALEQARHGSAFCADAHALFAAAFTHRGDLMSFVEAHAGATDIGGICTETRPVLAKSAAPAQKVRMAEAQPAEIGGVPAHSAPAIPYRRQEAAPPRVENDAKRDDDEEDDALSYADENAPPPPRPRYYDQRDYYADRGYGYAPPQSYGPPPGWQRDWRDYPPPPRYGWYPAGPYGRW